jgi:hypothetical protein
MEEAVSAPNTANATLITVKLFLADVVVEVITDQANVSAETIPTGDAMLSRRLLFQTPLTSYLFHSMPIQHMPPLALQHTVSICSVIEWLYSQNPPFQPVYIHVESSMACCMLCMLYA